MDVTLSPDVEKFIENEVKSGRFADPNEFINEAVYLYLVNRDRGAEEYTIEEIDQMVAEGLADFDRGDFLDGEEAFRRLRAHSAERRKQA